MGVFCRIRTLRLKKSACGISQMSLICNKTRVKPDDRKMPLGRMGKPYAPMLPCSAAASRNTANGSSNRAWNGSKRGCPRAKPEPTSCHQTVVSAASHSHQPPFAGQSHRRERPQNGRRVGSCLYLGRRYLARKETVRENFSRQSSLSESCRQHRTHPPACLVPIWWAAAKTRVQSPLRCLCNRAGVWTHVLGLLFYDTPVWRQKKKTGRLPLGPLETERWGRTGTVKRMADRQL